MEIVFRAVDPRDHAATRQVVDAAFQREDVVTFLDALRADGCVLGEWLAEDATGPVGLIAFSRVWLDQRSDHRLPGAMLTPLAVRPDRRRLGIGTRLMVHSLEALEANGETLFFVLGHPSYYPRAGFRSELAERVESLWLRNPAFMARANFVPSGRLILPSVIANAP